MRRRALLTTSQQSGGGGGIETTLQFPLYIYFDECVSIFLQTTCDAFGDFSELSRYLAECAITYGEEEGEWYALRDENISKIGEIYIEDEPLRAIYKNKNYDNVDYNTLSYTGYIADNMITGDKSGNVGP